MKIQWIIVRLSELFALVNLVVNSPQVIDYTKFDARDVVEHGSVDFLFDTMGLAMQYLCLMRSGSSRIVSISTLPSGSQLQDSSVMDLPHHPTVPTPFWFALNVLDQVRRYRAQRYGVEYSYMFLDSTGKDLDELRNYVEDGKLKTVVGMIAEIHDVESVRNACNIVYSGKGSVGKSVIRISKNGTPE